MQLAVKRRIAFRSNMMKTELRNALAKQVTGRSIYINLMVNHLHMVQYECVDCGGGFGQHA
jgi:hypothetical protein